MARAVVWSARARSDLRLSIEYIREDSPEAARRFGQAMIQAARSLAEMPERGRMVPEFRDPALREILLSRYRLIYEVFGDRIAVTRVIHASRDLMAAWRPSP